MVVAGDNAQQQQQAGVLLSTSTGSGGGERHRAQASHASYPTPPTGSGSTVSSIQSSSASGGMSRNVSQAHQQLQAQIQRQPLMQTAGLSSSAPAPSTNYVAAPADSAEFSYGNIPETVASATIPTAVAAKAAAAAAGGGPPLAALQNKALRRNSTGSFASVGGSQQQGSGGGPTANNETVAAVPGNSSSSNAVSSIATGASAKLSSLSRSKVLRPWRHVKRISSRLTGAAGGTKPSDYGSMGAVHPVGEEGEEEEDLTDSTLGMTNTMLPVLAQQQQGHTAMGPTNSELVEGNASSEVGPTLISGMNAIMSELRRPSGSHGSPMGVSGEDTAVSRDMTDAPVDEDHETASVVTAAGRLDQEWIVYWFERNLRYLCLVLGAYLLGLYRPEWGKAFSKAAEYATVAWITCVGIIVVAAGQRCNQRIRTNMRSRRRIRQQRQEQRQEQQRQRQEQRQQRQQARKRAQAATASEGGEEANNEQATDEQMQPLLSKDNIRTRRNQQERPTYLDRLPEETTGSDGGSRSPTSPRELDLEAAETSTGATSPATTLRATTAAPSSPKASDDGANDSQHGSPKSVCQTRTAPGKVGGGERTAQKSASAQTSQPDEASTAIASQDSNDNAGNILAHPSLEPFFVVDCSDGQRIFPNTIPYKLDTDYFTGKVFVLIRTPDVDQDPDQQTRVREENAAAVRFFRGKQRRFEFQFQVKLKKVPTGRVYFSCELEESVKMGMIQRAFVAAAMAFVKASNNSFHYSITGSPREANGRYEKPHMAFPVEEGMNRVVATPPGQPIPKLGEEIFEDPESIKWRRKGGRIEWNCDDTYTLSMWSAYVDFLDWRCLNLPGIRPFEIINVIGHQPINLTLYEIAEDRPTDNHYRCDRSQIAHLEMCHGKKAMLGEATKRYLSNHSQMQTPCADTTVSEEEDDDEVDEEGEEDTMHDAAEEMEGVGPSLTSVVGDDAIEESMRSEEDAVAELGAGIYIESGDAVTLRERSTANNSTSCFVTNGGGFAVLQDQNSSTIVIEKMERNRVGRSRRSRSKLIKNGDTVTFKLVPKKGKVGSEDAETQYLSIHRGWWLKWVPTAPSKNGFFTIVCGSEFSGNNAGNVDGSLPRSVPGGTQSMYLTIGGSFWLRHRRWSKYLVGVAAEGSATYGGRMLGLYTPNKDGNNSIVSKDEKFLAGDESEDFLDFRMDAEGEKAKGDEWMRPLQLCAYEPVSPAQQQAKPADGEPAEEDTATSDKEDKIAKLVFSRDDCRMDAPAWIEMMNRTDRMRQLTYVVRVSPPGPSATSQEYSANMADDGAAIEQQSSSNCEPFMRLRTGRDLAQIMRVGLNWRNNDNSKSNAPPPSSPLRRRVPSSETEVPSPTPPSSAPLEVGSSMEPRAPSLHGATEVPRTSGNGNAGATRSVTPTRRSSLSTDAPIASFTEAPTSSRTSNPRSSTPPRRTAQSNDAPTTSFTETPTAIDNNSGSRSVTPSRSSFQVADTPGTSADRVTSNSFDDADDEDASSGAWDVESGDEMDEESSIPGVDSATDAASSSKKPKGRQFIAKVAKSTISMTASTGKSVVRQSVSAGKSVVRQSVSTGKGVVQQSIKVTKGVGKGTVNAGKAVGKGTVNAGKAVGKGTVNAGKAVGKGTVNAGKAVGKGTVNAGKAIIAPIRSKNPPSKEPKAAKTPQRDSRRRQERDLKVADHKTMKLIEEREVYDAAASQSVLAGELSAPEQSCRSVSSMLTRMSSLEPASALSTAFSTLLSSQVEQELELDDWFLQGGAMEVGVHVSKEPVLCDCLVARCLWESHWREEWCGLYAKGVAFYAPLTREPCLELSFSDIKSVRLLDGGSHSPIPGFPLMVLETAWLCHYVAFANEDSRDEFNRKLDEARSIFSGSSDPTKAVRDKELWKARFWQGFQSSIESSLSSGRGKWAEVTSGAKLKRRVLLNSRRMSFDLRRDTDLVGLVDKMTTTSLSFSPDSLEEQPLINFLDSTSQLRTLSLKDIDANSPVWFCVFVNIYHCLLQHALLLSVNGPLHKRSCDHFMRTSCYEIGDDVFSLAELYCCVIRGKMTRPIAPKPPYVDVSKTSSAHCLYALATRGSTVNFLLNTGDVACPSEVFVLSPQSLEAQINAQATDFIRRNVTVDVSRRVITLPKIFEVFRNDFTSDSAGAASICLQVCLGYLDESTSTRIFSLLQEEASPTIKYRQSAELYYPALKLKMGEPAPEDSC